MAERIFVKNAFNIYLEFLVWPMSHLPIWLPGDNGDVLAAVLFSFNRNTDIVWKNLELSH